ncbi:MAG: sigma-70 family RNA polymerase sigma factor [Planctomycetota bacterium]|nr:sigma-70 family RNA polymerase sigma factor [Planctomycetota bacterium]MDA1180685.1 sigma-70 family RNA polymerase sigma factor [Planctomycetota bacterium]
MTDTQLLLRAREGDCQAWQLLHARCMSVAWPYAFALVKNRGVTEEIVSESMLAFVRRLQDTDFGDGCVYAWLRRVVRNKACDYFRRREQQDRLLHVYGSTAAQQLNGNTAETAVDSEDVQRRVLATLEQLDDRQQHLLHLMYVENLTVRDIALRIDQSEKSVESLLYRARNKFRTLFPNPTTERTNNTERTNGKTNAQENCSLKSHDTPKPK